MWFVVLLIAAARGWEPLFVVARGCDSASCLHLATAAAPFQCEWHAPREVEKSRELYKGIIINATAYIIIMLINTLN